MRFPKFSCTSFRVKGNRSWRFISEARYKPPLVRFRFVIANYAKAAFANYGQGGGEILGCEIMGEVNGKE